MRLKTFGRKRCGISNVLAEVVLMAITLVIAVPLSSFVFGIFGSFLNPAQITPITVTCSAANRECFVALRNSGGDAASAAACSIYGTSMNLGAVSIPGGTTVQVLCHPPGHSPPTSNGLVEGTVALTSGLILTYYGHWT